LNFELNLKSLVPTRIAAFPILAYAFCYQKVLPRFDPQV